VLYACNRQGLLAGAAVFERATHYLSQHLDAVKERHSPGAPPIEFHASSSRRTPAAFGPWV